MPQKKRGRGRPPKEPELAPVKIKELAAIGCTDEEIGQLRGFSADTLTRNFAELLKKGQEAGTHERLP